MNRAIKQSLKASLLAVILLTAVPTVWAGIHITIAPPTLRIETHEHRSGYVWQSGYWRWTGNKHGGSGGAATMSARSMAFAGTTAAGTATTNVATSGSTDAGKADRPTTSVDLPDKANHGPSGPLAVEQGSDAVSVVHSPPARSRGRNGGRSERKARP